MGNKTAEAIEICEGCIVREGHDHRCWINIPFAGKDIDVRIIEVTGHESIPTTNGNPFVYEGSLRDLDSILTREQPCQCVECEEPTEKMLADFMGRI